MAGDRRPAGRADGLAAVATLRSDGRRLATTGPNGDLKLWDTTTRRRPTLLMRLSDRHRIVAAAWNHAAADLLATLSTDARISIWRLVDDRPQKVLCLRLPYCRSGLLAWLPKGTHVACAGVDGSVSVCDITSGRGHTEIVSDSSACLSISCGTDDVLRTVYEDGSIRRVLPLKQPGLWRTRRVPPLTAASWSATGDKLLASPGGGIVEVRDGALNVQWSRDLGNAEALILDWHGESEIVVADRSAHWLMVLDAHGRTLWETELATAPTSLSATNGVIAVGGCSFRPQIIELGSGRPMMCG